MGSVMLAPFATRGTAEWWPAQWAASYPSRLFEPSSGSAKGHIVGEAKSGGVTWRFAAAITRRGTMSIRSMRAAAFLILATGLGIDPAIAQGDRSVPFPTHAIKIVVPFPAGGPTDVNIRIIAHRPCRGPTGWARRNFARATMKRFGPPLPTLPARLVRPHRRETSWTPSR